MNKVILASAAAGLLGASPSFGATLFSDDFTYPSGSVLVGQGGWTEQASGTPSMLLSTIAAIPGSSVVRVSTTGQDASHPLSSALSLSSGTSFYFGMTLNVRTAQATGDHFTGFVAGSAIYARTFIKSSGSGFLLGYVEASNVDGSQPAPTYGATELSFNTNYRVVVAYNSVAGSVNDTAAVYLNPSDSINPSGNSQHLSRAWVSTRTEPTQAASLILRQGTSSAAPDLYLDDLSAGTSFVDASVFPPIVPVPEPSTWALFGAGVIGLGFVVRRKAK